MKNYKNFETNDLIEISFNKSRYAYRFWPWLLKAVLIAASFYYVVSKLFVEQLVFNELYNLFGAIEFALIFFVVTILMGLNWLFESKKWQLIAAKYQQISIIQAVKAILVGVSLDSILPFGAGAVGSKVLSLGGNIRRKLIASIILAQGIQSFWTVMFGLIGLTQLAAMTNLLAVYGGLKSLFLIGTLSILLVMAIVRFWPKILKYIISSVKGLSSISWVKIIIISFFRYVVFLGQLLLLSIYLAPEIPLWVLFGCITWMFFAKTIVPKPGHLGALGIRGASVIFFLSLSGYSYSGVVLATLILWFINLAIPSLVGLFFIKGLNFRTENK